MQPIIIPFSRARIRAQIGGCVMFVVIGVLLFVAAGVLHRNTFAVVISIFGGILSIGFFGPIGLTLIRKMNDGTPALVIDDKGITDNASGVAAGFIPWIDITNINTTAVMSTQFMLIHVHNPEFYMSRQTSWVKRKAMRANNSMYGTPITISNVALGISFDQLNSFLMQGAQNHFNHVR